MIRTILQDCYKSSKYFCIFNETRFSGSIALVIVDKVNLTEAFTRCQLAQPAFTFNNISFKLIPDISPNLPHDTEYWLGYISTERAYLYYGKLCQSNT